VQGYFRPKPKLYAYLQKVPVQRQYDVAYPYGVGGDNILDKIAGGVNFDNWVTSAILGYFLNRFIITPFGIPSVTDLLGQAFTAVTGRSVTGFEDYIKSLALVLSEIFGSDFFSEKFSRTKRSMADIGEAKMFSEIKETASTLLNSMNVSSVSDIFNADKLDFGEGNLPPSSVASLASVIGLAMIAQSLLGPGELSKGEFTNVDKISDRKLVVRRRKKKRKYPYYESEKDFPHHSGHKNRYFYHNNIQNHKPLEFADVPAIDDYDDIDFYEDKNYEYIDQEDMEAIKLNFETNRKISEENSDKVKNIKFNFKPIDYDNYEYEEVGLLNFRKTPPATESTFNKRLSKRRYPSAYPPAIHIVRPRRKQPIYAYGHLRGKKRVGTSPFLEGLGSRFDFGSMVTIAGLWYIWQAYLSGFVPTSIVQDLVNNIGVFGRSAKSDPKIQDVADLIVKHINEYQQRNQY